MKFFNRFTRPSATGWAWAFPSAAPSSRRMAVTYGQRTTRIIPARHFPLRCRWKKVSSDEEQVRFGRWQVCAKSGVRFGCQFSEKLLWEAKMKSYMDVEDLEVYQKLCQLH